MLQIKYILSCQMSDDRPTVNITTCCCLLTWGWSQSGWWLTSWIRKRSVYHLFFHSFILLFPLFCSFLWSSIILQFSLLFLLLCCFIDFFIIIFYCFIEAKCKLFAYRLNSTHIFAILFCYFFHLWPYCHLVHFLSSK